MSFEVGSSVRRGSTKSILVGTKFVGCSADDLFGYWFLNLVTHCVLLLDCPKDRLKSLGVFGRSYHSEALEFRF